MASSNLACWSCVRDLGYLRIVDDVDWLSPTPGNIFSQSLTTLVLRCGKGLGLLGLVAFPECRDPIPPNNGKRDGVWKAYRTSAQPPSILLSLQILPTFNLTPSFSCFSSFSSSQTTATTFASYCRPPSRYYATVPSLSFVVDSFLPCPFDL